MTTLVQPVLTVTGLTHTYGALTVLDDVDMEVGAGSRHALVGANGAGKTTLLQLIAGTTPVQTGQIRWRGTNITTRPAWRRARLGIGRSFQTPGVMASLTVADNLTATAWPHLPTTHAWRPGARRRQLAEPVARLLDLIGLTAHADTLAGQLAHGQRLLLDLGAALATCLPDLDPAHDHIAGPAGECRLLLLDEPTAGLDDRDITRLHNLLDGLPACTTVLIVEHHLDLVARWCDTVTTLHAGKATTTRIGGGTR